MISDIFKHSSSLSMLVQCIQECTQNDVQDCIQQIAQASTQTLVHNITNVTVSVLPQTRTQDDILKTLTKQQRSIIAIACIHMQDLIQLHNVMQYTIDQAVYIACIQYITANSKLPIAKKAKAKTVKAKAATVNNTSST